MRPSGEFHVLLAEIDGNAFVIKAMRELCSLTDPKTPMPGVAASPPV